MSGEKTALVLGGTGAVGSAVVRELSRNAIPVAFTYHRNEALASSLEKEFGARAVGLDLRDPGSLAGLREALRDATPDIVVHCAVSIGAARLEDTSDEDWEAVMGVNARSAFWVCRDLGSRMAKGRGGDIVLVSALDRAQSLPIPPVFAASEGALSALAMAAAKELGPSNVRVNVVALGLLEEGIGKELDPKLVDAYKAQSALRRLGTAEEAARTIAWIATKNTYLNGKVVSANGGI